MKLDEALAKLPDENIDSIKKIATISFFEKKLSMI